MLFKDSGPSKIHVDGRAANPLELVNIDTLRFSCRTSFETLRSRIAGEAFVDREARHGLNVSFICILLEFIVTEPRKKLP